MNLAERQEQIITAYLREVARLAGDGVSETGRERGLAKLEERIRTAIAKLRKAQLEDAEVHTVLKALGTPAVQAALLEAPMPGDVAASLEARRVWLGVCHWAAGRYEFPVQGLRGVVLLVGLCTGPLSLLGYVIAYGLMRREQPREERAPIDWMLIVWRASVCFLALYALGTGFEYLLRFVEAAYSQGVDRGLPPISGWSELRYKSGEYYGYTFLSAIPLAAFSALPLSRAWSKTLYRFAQALIALYAITLCYGVAKFLVGVIMDFVKQFAGNVDLPLKEFF